MRNLRISIAKNIIAKKYSLEQEYTLDEIAQNFLFRKRDLKYYKVKFFQCRNGKYRLNKHEMLTIRKILANHEKALS